MTEKYSKLCSENDCYNNVDEYDIERNAKGEIYERSKKCGDCRSKQDRNAIKKWRQKQHKLNKLESIIK